MTLNHILKTTLFVFTLVIAACGGGSNDVRDSARESLGGNTDAAAPTSATSTPLTASAPAGVFHYICPKNCAGSGGSAAGTCPVCGTAYEHNQAYHNQPTSTTVPTGETTPDGRPIEKMIVPGSTTPGTAPANTPPATPEPAQNAAGVWHYTCPKGCAGGAGSAVACGTCGSTLAHNTAYHQ